MQAASGRSSLQPPYQIITGGEESSKNVKVVSNVVLGTGKPIGSVGGWVAHQRCGHAYRAEVCSSDDVRVSWVTGDR